MTKRSAPMSPSALPPLPPPLAIEVSGDELEVDDLGSVPHAGDVAMGPEPHAGELGDDEVDELGPEPHAGPDPVVDLGPCFLCGTLGEQNPRVSRSRFFAECRKIDTRFRRMCKSGHVDALTWNGILKDDELYRTFLRVFRHHVWYGYEAGGSGPSSTPRLGDDLAAT